MKTFKKTLICLTAILFNYGFCKAQIFPPLSHDCELGSWTGPEPHVANIDDVANNFQQFITDMANAGIIVTGTSPNYVIHNQTFIVEDIFTIDNYNILLDGCTIYMGSGSVIHTGSGPNSVFTIHNCDIGAFCGEMWQGIMVGHDGQMHVDGLHIFDAQYAISIDQKMMLDLRNSYFDRNYVSIFVPGVSSSNYFMPGSNIENNDFSGLTPLYDPFSGQNPTPAAFALAGFEIHSLVVNILGATIPFNTDPAHFNFFHNLNIGILAYESEINVNNCHFQDIQIAAGYNGTANFNGYAVAAQNPSNSFTATNLRVGDNNQTGITNSNIFQNVNGGVRAQRKVDSYIINNTFDRYQFATLFSENNNRIIQIRSNTFTDIPYNGGTGFISSGIRITSGAQTTKHVTINGNEFNDNRIGIYINNTIGPFNEPINIASNVFNSTLVNSDMDDLIGGQGYIFTGIWLLNSGNADIVANILTRNISTANITSNFRNNMRGIFFNNSQNNSASYNSSINYGSHYRFVSNCNNTDLTCNTMTTDDINQVRGVNLINASMTAQGVPGTGWSNSWNGFTTPSAITFNRVHGNVITPFDWYYFGVANTAGNNPSNNLSPEPLALAIITPHSNQPNRIVCNTPPPDQLIDIDNLLAIANNTKDYLEYPEESRYMDRQFAFNLLDENEGLRDQYDEFQTFYTEQQNTNLSKFREVEKYFENDEFESALEILNEVAPENAIETDWKYALMIAGEKMLNNDDNFTADEVSNLTEIAHKPTYTGGPGVATSRHLLNLEVEDGTTDERLPRESGGLSIANFIFNNPSDGILTFSGEKGALENIQIFVRDMQGRIIFSGKIHNGNVNLTTLSNGLYTIELAEKDQLKTAHKLIISK